MSKTLTAVLFAAVFSFPLSAQGLQPIGQIDPHAQALDGVASLAVPALDRPTLANEDDVRHQQGLPPRYAVPYPVLVSPGTHGTWEQLDATWSLWRLRVQAPGASHVNFGFTQFHLPPSGRLMVYSSDYQNVVRPFTAADHAPSGELWTPVVGGEEVVIEVYVQTAQQAQVALVLSQIGSGYRFFGAGATALIGVDAPSGPCQVDVACPVSAPWALEIPSVAAISTGGSIFCTGFMVNNTAQDNRNFFMTAEHCGITTINAPSLVCYWNYQRAVCGAGAAPLTMFNTGSTFRATYTNSDFTLVELTTSPDPLWGVTYLGWDRGLQDPTSSCGIHHPSGDMKKISFENDPSVTTSYLGTNVPGNGSHIQLIAWDLGTTEPGSSGSPLLDQNHRVVGQLHGGYSACSAQNLADWYGRFSTSWSGGGAVGTRLSDWLDPLATNQQTLNTITNNAALATAYGLGCYAEYASFYELFGAGGCDLAGTATTTTTLVFTPSGSTGYNVALGGNNWYAPVSSSLGVPNEAVSSPITMPFQFNYPGGSTIQLRVCDNGYLWLSAFSTGVDPTPTGAELCTGGARLTPLWMDLDPTAGGSIHYDADVANQVVYVTWFNVPAAGSTGAGNTFQVALRQNGTFEYRYRTITNTGTGALAGWSRGANVNTPPNGIDISAALPFPAFQDVPGLSIAASGRPVQGQSITLDISQIPSGTIFGGIFFGFGKNDPGLSLAQYGMPGCFQYCSQQAMVLIVATNPTYNFPFNSPPGTAWTGLHMYAQTATLSAGFNQLGALSSNGLDLLLGPN